MSALASNSTTQVLREPQRVFVYGTLKEGHGNHRNHLANARKLGVAKLEGIMFHLGGYPAINLSDRFSDIHGEVYQCDYDTLLSLDRLEGHPDFYRRVEVAILQYSKAWVYIMPADRCTTFEYIIPSGNWRGSATPKAKWAGWRKGIELGTWSASSDEIRVGPSRENSPFILRRNSETKTYDMVNTKTGEVIGKGYKTMKEMITSSTVEQNSLRGRNPSISVPAVVQQQLPKSEAYTPPDRQLVVVPSTEKKDIKEPQQIFPDEDPVGSQAAALLGLTVSQA